MAEVDTDLRFSVLGPLQVWRGKELVQLGPVKQRQVLARLLLADGRPVPRAVLIETLWPEGAPSNASRAVQSYVGRLRRLLEPDRPSRQPSRLLVTVEGGFGLTSAQTDLARVRALVEQADRAASPAEELRLLREAAALRQGRLFEDLTGLPERGEIEHELDQITQRISELDAGLLGRETELRYLAETLPETGSVTLVGPGGVGKTALASALAARQSPDYPDGVAVASLGPLPADASLEVTAETIRIALDVERDRDGALPAILRAVREKRVLLVLDDAAHLVDGARQVVLEVLRAARQAHVLVTSRIPLGLSGEEVWRVPPLATAPSVELLHGRPNVVESPVMAQLVDALGGLPLAIELATALLRVMPAEQLRDHLVRRQDLHAAFELPWPTLDWALDLLPVRERLLLCRMTVFPGATTPSAVIDVCGHPPLTAEEIPALLTRLRDGRLIGPDGSVRPGLRELCGQLSDDPATIRDRLLAHCLLAVLEGRKLNSGDALTALSWALRPDAGPVTVQAGAELIAASWREFTNGEAGAGPVLSLTLRALDHPAGLPAQLCAALNLRAGRLLMRMGRPRHARPHLERAIKFFDFGPGRLEAMRHLLALDLADVHPSVQALIASTAAEARAAGDGQTLPFLGLASAWLGRTEEAIALVLEGQAMVESLEHPEHAAVVFLRAGQPAECLVRAEALVDRGGLVGAQALLARGWALMVTGDLAGASAALSAGEDIVRRSGSLAVLPDFHEAHAHVARLSGELTEAWSRTRRALQRCVDQQDSLTGTRVAYLTLALARATGHAETQAIARLSRECRLRTGLPAWPFADLEMTEWEIEAGADDTPAPGWYPDAVPAALSRLLSVV
jgi:predicted ATPase/DNA-binding winged helix-turn-helix (wHTH) protein